jgi:hypothetical protein
LKDLIIIEYMTLSVKCQALSLDMMLWEMEEPEIDTETGNRNSKTGKEDAGCRRQDDTGIME